LPWSRKRVDVRIAVVVPLLLDGVKAPVQKRVRVGVAVRDVHGQVEVEGGLGDDLDPDAVLLLDDLCIHADLLSWAGDDLRPRDHGGESGNDLQRRLKSVREPGLGQELLRAVRLGVYHSLNVSTGRAHGLHGRREGTRDRAQAEAAACRISVRSTARARAGGPARRERFPAVVDVHMSKPRRRRAEGDEPLVVFHEEVVFVCLEQGMVDVPRAELRDDVALVGNDLDLHAST